MAETITHEPARTVAEELTAYDNAAVTEAGKGTLPRASTPAWDTGRDVRLVTRQGRHINIASITTGLRIEHASDDDLVRLFDTAQEGDVSVLFTTPSETAALRNLIQARAKMCGRSDKVVAGKLWVIWRYLGWLIESAPQATMNVSILTRILRRGMWAGSVDDNKLATWVKAAGIADTDVAAQATKLLELVPGDITGRDLKPSQIDFTRQWVGYFIEKVIDAEKRIWEGFGGFRQTGEARVFDQSEKVVSLWEAIDGLDEGLRERNAIAGAAIDVVAVEPGDKNRTWELEIRGAVTWRTGTKVLVTHGFRTWEGELVSASAEVDGTQFVTVSTSKSGDGQARMTAGSINETFPAALSVGTPLMLHRKSGDTIWFNERYAQLPDLDRKVPFDVELAAM